MAEQEQQDVDSLKRRGRRRLVGAVALVLLAVIVLPMVFDPEPRNAAPPVSVTIPGQEESAFTPKGAKPQPRPVEKAPEAPAQVAAPEEQKAAVGKKTETAKPEAPKPVAKERARAEAAIANAEFMVPVGAFANPDNVVAKLVANKVPYFTEAAPGNLTRVRAGPFATREAAEKAVARLKSLGLQPGAVANRSG